LSLRIILYWAFKLFLMNLSSLAKMAKSERVHYRDIGAVFTQKDGTISQDIMPDLLHLSPEGYTLWAEAIKGDIEKFAK